ncbi:MAG: DNA primase [bacterium]
MISQETIERIRSETDIVELIGGYLPLKKVGRNFRGVCPFHPDRSPSFYVSPERQTFHCFGCGIGGNAVSFVIEREKLTFPEAVRFLGKRLGIEVADDRPSLHQGVYEACEQAARFYEQQLRTTEAALRYLVKREIPPDAVKRFRLGYAPPGGRLRAEARRRGWDLGALERAGLVVDRGSGPVDYFTGRLMFPIFSIGGKVIGFGGRVLDDREPKYLNSPETEIFRKGDGLYGLFQAKAYLRDAPALLVEGNFDLLALVGRGFPNTVAPLGTALTTGQALLLRRFTGSVTVCFDGDEAGQRAVRRSLPVLLAGGLVPLVVRLPEGSDPDDVIRQSGRDGFARLLEQAVDFVAHVTGGRVPVAVADQRRVLGELVDLLAVIPDPATRELFANRVSAMFKVDKRVLAKDAPRRPGTARKPPARPAVEEQLVAAVVQDAGLARVAAELGLAELIADEELRAIVEAAQRACGEEGYGPAMLLDRFEADERRQRIAGWTFVRAALPSAEEFRARVQRMLAARLQRQIVTTEDGEQAERLAKEHTQLQRAAHRGDIDELEKNVE